MKVKDKEIVRTKLDKIIEFLGNQLSLLFIVIVAISFYEVYMRYFRDSPTIWVHELAAFLGGSLFVFGGAFSLATDNHVRVVLIYDAVSPKTRAYLKIFHHIMGIIFSLIMTWAAFVTLKMAWFAPWGDLRLETSATAWNPPFPAFLKAIILITMIILTIQFILHLITEIKRLSTRYYDQLGDSDV